MPNNADDGLTLLENAYSLSDPDSNTRYYNQLADTYDSDFAQGLGYVLPQAIAEVFGKQSTADDYPVLDIGCGTGLVAELLNIESSRIDGADISRRMLDLANDKQLYGNLHEVDLTQSLQSIANDYGAVVSAGTFTHGHLGPEVLASLLDIACDGALFVVGVNQQHFTTLKFDELLDGLAQSRKITQFESLTIPIYSQAGHSHSNDMARVLSYRKAG